MNDNASHVSSILPFKELFLDAKDIQPYLSELHNNPHKLKKWLDKFEKNEMMFIVASCVYHELAFIYDIVIHHSSNADFLSGLLICLIEKKEDLHEIPPMNTDQIFKILRHEPDYVLNLVINKSTSNAENRYDLFTSIRDNDYSHFKNLIKKVDIDYLSRILNLINYLTLSIGTNYTLSQDIENLSMKSEDSVSQILYLLMPNLITFLYNANINIDINIEGVLSALKEVLLLPYSVINLPNESIRVLFNFPWSEDLIRLKTTEVASLFSYLEPMPVSSWGNLVQLQEKLDKSINYSQNIVTNDLKKFLNDNIVIRDTHKNLFFDRFIDALATYIQSIRDKKSFYALCYLFFPSFTKQGKNSIDKIKIHLVGNISWIIEPSNLEECAARFGRSFPYLMQFIDDKDKKSTYPSHKCRDILAEKACIQENEWICDFVKAYWPIQSDAKVSTEIVRPQERFLKSYNEQMKGVKNE